MDKIIEEKLSKEERIEKEKQELYKKVVTGNISTTKEKVAYILNNYPDARNSDVELTWLYWETYEGDIFNGSYVTKSHLKKLTKMRSLIRQRAKIQNEYKLFQASGEVKRFRKNLEDQNFTQALEDKPSGPITKVVIDETGKTQDYLSVGSLWVIDQKEFFFGANKLREWVKKSNLDFEFHFSKCNKRKLDLYKQFFSKFLSLLPSVGFKVIVINKRGIKDINSAITDLTFHLINKGIRQEDSTGRSPLPRFLQIEIDREETGSDQLKSENIKERIISQNIKGLNIDSISAVDSKENLLIQITDLFTSSINRKLHSNNNNAKDALADYILNLLDFDVNQIDTDNNNADNSTLFDLTTRKEDLKVESN